MKNITPLLLFALGVFILALLLSPLWLDESLNPKAQQRMQKVQQLPADNSALMYLLGLNAAVSHDALRVGQKRYQSMLRSHREGQPYADPYTETALPVPDAKQLPSALCFNKSPDCQQTLLDPKQATAISDFLEKHAVLLARFKRYLASPPHTTPVFVEWRRSSSDYLMYSTAAIKLLMLEQLYQAQQAKTPAAQVALLRQAEQYLQQIRSKLHAKVSTQARLTTFFALSHQIETLPTLAAHLDQPLQSISLLSPEERSLADHYAHDLLYYDYIYTPLEAHSPLVFKKNLTLNSLWNYYSPFIEASEGTATEFARASEPLKQAAPKLNPIRNALGSNLNATSPTNLHDIIKETFALNGRLLLINAYYAEQLSLEAITQQNYDFFTAQQQPHFNPHTQQLCLEYESDKAAACIKVGT